MNTKSLISIFTLTIFLVICTSVLIARDTASIKAYVGNVKVERNRSVKQVKNGDPILDGDILHIGKESMVAIETVDDHVLKIHGPKKFLVREKHLVKDIRQSSLLDRLSSKVIKGIPQCSRRTITSGTRGLQAFRTTRGEDRKQEILKKIENASREYQKKNYDRALALFMELDDDRDVPGIIKSNIQFFIAEIYFVQMKYGKALDLFEELYELDEEEEFDYRELSLARAIICSHHLGKHRHSEELARKYVKIYGTKGMFYNIINDI